MDKSDLRELLVERGALKNGHFRLSSGRHSDTYVQCAKLLEDSPLAAEIGRNIASLVDFDVDMVLCPVLGAVVIGYTTALALGLPMAFSERSSGSMVLRRGFEIEPGTRVLLVEDVITTGGSIMELAGLAREAGAEVAGLACIIDRGEASGFSYPVISLLKVEASTYDPDECPLCLDGADIDTPGSRHTA